jgi:hypothetical protein
LFPLENIEYGDETFLKRPIKGEEDHGCPSVSSAYLFHVCSSATGHCVCSISLHMGHSVSPSVCFKECLTKTNEVIISAEFAYDFLGWEISYNVIKCTETAYCRNLEDVYYNALT